MDGSIHWHSAIHWSGGWDGKTKAARAVLEQLYSTGELIIHHKKGTRKFYDVAENHIPAEFLKIPDPLTNEIAHQKWRMLRRIGAVGLLWNRPSDAWLNIWGLKAPLRSEIFWQLLDEEKIIEVAVERLKYSLYCRTEYMPLIETVLENEKYKSRSELIAPLDCLIWDRKLIKALFNFDYTWEIYTPADKRKYGFYVLPLIYGDSFVGRVEAVNDRKTKTLIIKNIWFEDDVRHTKKLQTAIDSCMKRFMKFNECEAIRS